jgi:DNA-binding NarL/FixJ family response regulator
MAGDSQTELLESIDSKLSAILVLFTDCCGGEARTSKAKPKAKTRNIDQLLSAAGLSNAEIARLLGKSPQAVSQQLNKKNKRKG